MENIFDKQLLDELFKQAAENPRLRQNMDLRTSSADTSQRMLNVLQPGTKVPVHRHTTTSETVICMFGKLDEIIYDENGVETQRVRLCPAEGQYGMQVPAGAWHSIEVIEPSVIFEAKDGAYAPARPEDIR